MPEIDYLAAGERFAREALAPMLRPEAMARVAWHKARSYKAAIVSGAHDVYLSRWCRTHDIEPICSTLEVQDGVFTGRYGGAQCVRERKPRRVRERYATDSFDAVYACGDTPEDFALLEIAEHRWYRGDPMWRGVWEGLQPRPLSQASGPKPLPQEVVHCLLTTTPATRRASPRSHLRTGRSRDSVRRYLAASSAAPNLPERIRRL